MFNIVFFLVYYSSMWALPPPKGIIKQPKDTFLFFARVRKFHLFDGLVGGLLFFSRRLFSQRKEGLPGLNLCAKSLIASVDWAPSLWEHEGHKEDVTPSFRRYFL